MINKNEQGYLQELAVTGRKLQQEKEKLGGQIKENKIVKEIDGTKEEIVHLQHKIEQMKTEISTLQATLEKIDVEKSKTDVTEKINNVFNVEMRLIF